MQTTTHGESASSGVDCVAHQGCALSPALFKYSVDWVLNSAVWATAAFTLAHLAGSPAWSTSMISQSSDPVVRRSSNQAKKGTHQNKDEALSSCSRGCDVVDSFIYLGSLVTNASQEAIEFCIGKARAIFTPVHGVAEKSPFARCPGFFQIHLRILT